MRKLLLRRPSPALVIACVALGVALGGTGYATVLQVPRNSVGPAQLKASAVTTGKLAPNAVTSAKVLNRSLLRADFAAGQLPAGPTGPTGPTGPVGPPGLSGVERVETTSASNSVPAKTAFMACPTGKRLLGGGARLNPVLAQVAIQQSYPDNDNIYRASAREIVGTPVNWSLTVFAVCANAS
jgi:hypothetical protein